MPDQLPGEACVKVGPDEHLLKICRICGGTVHLLVQNGRLVDGINGTCRCLSPLVTFQVIVKD